MSIQSQASNPATHDSIPAGARIGHVHLHVGDIDRSLAFYRDILGFDVIMRHGDVVAFVSAGGYHHHIGLNTWQGRGAPPAPRNATGLYHFAINYPTRKDLGIAVQRLRRAGWQIEGMSDHGTHEAVYLSDPDGNGIELAWDRDPERWPRTPAEMAAAQRPLDLRGLLAEAGDADWADGRAPSETRIGHVHLKVSDLDQSVRFYRDLLGFDLFGLYGSDAAFLSAGGYHHHLGLNTWESKGAGPQPSGRAGLYHFAINYPTRSDLAAAVRRLFDRGWSIDGLNDHQTHMAIYLHDPDQIGIELAWDRDPSQWPRDARGNIDLTQGQGFDIEEFVRDRT